MNQCEYITKLLNNMKGVCFVLVINMYLCYELYSYRLRQNLEYLNKSKEEVIKKQLQKATDNLVATLRYEFLDDKGPRRQNITKFQPLFSR